MNHSSHNADMTTRHQPTADDDLIRGYLDHLRLIKRSPDTIRTYSSLLHAGDQQLPEGLPYATPGELLRWAAEAPARESQRARCKAAAGFFRWATAAGHLDWNPMVDVPRPSQDHQLPDVPTDDQVARVLSGTPADVRTWCTLAAYAGLRRVEVTRLHRADVGREVLIHGKGHKDRLVPTHPAVRQLVDELPNGPVTHLTPDQLGNRVHHACRVVGVPIGIHRFRAWFAQTMLRAGHDLATVQDLLGHASPATTRRYATPSGAQVRAAVSSLPTLAAAPTTAEAAAGHP